MNKYPMKLVPVPRRMIWGGNTLKTKYNKSADFNELGESWELCCRNEAKSIIENGEYAGRYLCDILSCGTDFPLLIKFIDSGDRLSVQVHPGNDVTDENGTPLGKTEMWYIIDAKEDSHIIYGLCDGITIENFKERIENNNFEDLLRKVHVKAGDCFFIPAGQIHAIGKGIVLAEIQQNSDTTYRLYDYGRLDKDGKPRELHIKQALNVMKARTDSDIDAIRYSKGKDVNSLANCDKFSCSLIKSPVTLFDSERFSALVFIEGEGYINYNGEKYPAKGGDTYYIPEGISIDISGNLKFLTAKAN